MTFPYDKCMHLCPSGIFILKPDVIFSISPSLYVPREYYKICPQVHFDRANQNTVVLLGLVAKDAGNKMHINGGMMSHQVVFPILSH